MIFSAKRRYAVQKRIRHLQQRPNAARYIADDMAEDVLERLNFLNHNPRNILVIGEITADLTASLRLRGAEVTCAKPADGFNDQLPFPAGNYDFIAALGTLDNVNDLPGALIHIRNALAKNGSMIASFMGAGSLPQLRAAMLAADGSRPAPRLHPMVDVRAGGQLLQRAGIANPVVDSRGLDVTYRGLNGLIADLRAQGLGNVLASPGPTLTREQLAIATQNFTDAAENGRTTEHFEILTLSGWRL
jgi:SAM-dependent methyltransferase